jgi:hypothetical protein
VRGTSVVGTILPRCSKSDGITGRNAPSSKELFAFRPKAVVAFSIVDGD